jgi:hypothetical protein
MACSAMYSPSLAGPLLDPPALDLPEALASLLADKARQSAAYLLITVAAELADDKATINDMVKIITEDLTMLDWLEDGIEELVEALSDEGLCAKLIKKRNGRTPDRLIEESCETSVSVGSRRQDWRMATRRRREGLPMDASKARLWLASRVLDAAGRIAARSPHPLPRR